MVLRTLDVNGFFGFGLGLVFQDLDSVHVYRSFQQYKHTIGCRQVQEHKRLILFLRYLHGKS